MKKDKKNFSRDKTRDRGGWKAERSAARRQKGITRGNYTGKRVARAQGRDT